jgi:hypothetical protein
MSDSAITNGQQSPKTSILTVSMARYLVGHDIADVITHDWDARATVAQKERFFNQGFNLDPTDAEGTLKKLEATLKEKEWDGVILGWCIRGHKDFTPLFERVASKVVDEIVRRRAEGGEMKLMFCEGPEDLVKASIRNFPDA